MSVLPKLWAGVFAASLAMASVPAAFAKTPADQLIVGMSMINLLSPEPAAATGLDVSEVNANLSDMLPVQDAKPQNVLVPALAEVEPEAQRQLALSHDVQNYRGHAAATTRYKDVQKSR